MSETAGTHRGPFQEGELVLLVDFKGRHYQTRLARGEAFYTHMGHVAHEEIIGQEEGSWLTTSKKHLLLVFRPTLADFVQEMPRASQVIYPKDLGAILIYADIFPGARVLEAGLGSGSDVYDGVEERDLDRIVLDVPEPWRVIPVASEALVPGGIFLSFLPTILQVHELVNALNDSRGFQMIHTSETMLRTWHVTRRSVRPDHRMVAHTGFLVTARKATPRGVQPDGESTKGSTDV